MSRVVVDDVVYQLECKRRKRLPAMVTDALAQAKRYSPAAVPVAVLREHGGRALAVVELAVFARLLGVDTTTMPTKHKPTRKDPRQLDWLETTG